LEVFLELLILLIVGRACGEAAERLRQPASAGEIFAGIVLAAIVAWFGQDIPFVAALVSSEALIYTADVGIFCLVFLAGIEMEPKEVAQSPVRSLAVAIGGMVVPLIGGVALAWLFLPDSEQRQTLALLTGIVLSITALPATVKVLEEFDLLHTRVGELIVGAALFDDVLGLFLLAVLLAVIETGHVPEMATLALLIGKVVVFFTITVVLGAHVYPHVSRGLNLMQAAAFEFSALAVIGLAYGLLAEALGMHWVLGAFMAGLFFEPSRVGITAYNEIKLIFTAVTSGFLAPLFFVSIGLRVDLAALTGVPLFLLLLLAAAFLGKVLGAGLPALWTGLPRREALAVGVGMSARGAVELVVLSIAYDAGLFAQADHTDPVTRHLFSSLVLMGVVTTMLAPVLLRYIFPRSTRQDP